MMRKFAVLIALVAVLGGGLTIYLVNAGAAGAAGAAQAPQLIFYWGENFTGRSLTITDTTFDLAAYVEQSGEKVNWNDEIRSVSVVSGTWRLYQHGRCNTKLDKTALANFDVTQKDAVGGWSTLLSGTSTGPLQIPNPAAGGFWRDISSIELVSEQNLPDWAMDFRR